MELILSLFLIGNTGHSHTLMQDKVIKGLLFFSHVIYLDVPKYVTSIRYPFRVERGPCPLLV